MDRYYVYIICSQRNGTLYIGMTGDLKRRVYEHKTGAYPNSFSRRYGVSILVYYEGHRTFSEAFSRERTMKAWKRRWKLELIEKENIDWLDLSEGWYD